MRLVLEKPVKRLPTPTETASIAILAGGAVVISLQRIVHHDLLFCPLHTVTGLPCPLCGGTRAVIALTHGDFPLALTYNPLALVLFAAMITAALLYLMLVLPLRTRPVLLTQRWERRVGTALIAAAFAANWIYVFSAGMYKVPIA